MLLVMMQTLSPSGDAPAVRLTTGHQMSPVSSESQPMKTRSIFNNLQEGKLLDSGWARAVLAFHPSPKWLVALGTF
jgi:hypothetical protein